MAGLFDPMLAVATSDVEPLPHQIRAVYGELLPRTPLRFLLADDPGAGKTIMAGLYIKELMLRGDLARCLVVAPGGLVEQWQDELLDKFGLDFEMLTSDHDRRRRSAGTGLRAPPAADRADGPARAQRRPAQPARAPATGTWWSSTRRTGCRAHYFGDELKTTKRYELGQLLGTIARHLLLMTATPHAGKEEDFQLFLALLDPDRFEGKFRRGVHADDTAGSDAPHGQGGAAHLRGQAAVPGADRLDRALRAVRRSRPSCTSRSPATSASEMNRADRLGRQSRGQHRRLRAHRAAAPAGLEPGGDPAVAAAPRAAAGASADQLMHRRAGRVHRG